MAIDSFEKQPWEKYWVSASFANDLGDAESIAIGVSTVTATDVNGDDATADVITSGTASVDGQLLRVHVEAGTELLSPYKITFRAATDSNPVNGWEKDVRMKVKEL